MLLLSWVKAMKKVFIATTNIDKYNVVSKIFKNTIFKEDEYEIICQSKDMNIKDIFEEGNNVERARKKALNAYDSLKEYNFDYIVGLDDAIVINNKIEPDVRKYINKILYENYLNDGEEYSFNRAYCIVDNDKNIYEVNLSIPQIYHPLNKIIEVKDHTYPLSNVSYPIGYDKPINELSEEEATNYYLKYVKDGLLNLNIK